MKRSTRDLCSRASIVLEGIEFSDKILHTLAENSSTGGAEVDLPQTEHS